MDQQQPESGQDTPPWGEGPFAPLIQRMSVSITRQALAVSRLEGEREAARRDLHVQADLIDSLRRDLAAQQRLTGELTRQLGLLQDRAVYLQHQGQQSDRAAAAARRQLDRVLVSPSWRMLSPWRACVRLSRRAQHRSLRRQLRRHVDRDWYVQQYPEVKASEYDALGHFIAYGTIERRDPNPAFSTDWYLRCYPDVAAAGINPLSHFLKYGLAEGRDPHPEVSYETYLQRYR